VVLGGSTDSKLLEVRVFDAATSRTAYEKQTAEAKKTIQTDQMWLGATGNGNDMVFAVPPPAFHVRFSTPVA
jgi:hypothetical protein